MNTLENYAMKILADAGCDCYTYGDEQATHLMDDLKEEYPNGMEYPYIDVANAILAISRPRPIVRKPWQMLWDNGEDCSGIGYDSFEAAKDAAEDTLAEWIASECACWLTDTPDEEERDRFNYMIGTCSVEVHKYNKDTDEYELYWTPSYEDEQRIGWVEI